MRPTAKTADEYHRQAKLTADLNLAYKKGAIAATRLIARLSGRPSVYTMETRILAELGLISAKQRDLANSGVADNSHEIAIREYEASDKTEADANRISMTHSMSETAAWELRERLTKKSRHNMLNEEIASITAVYAARFPEESPNPEI